MRKNVSRIICVILAAFLFSVTAYAGTCPDGTVVYRQNFADVSTASAAGVVNGTKNVGTFYTSVSNGALSINNYGDERAHVILPFYNESDNYTIRFSFAFADVKKSNGYFGFMLTCKGTEPSNITSVLLRANGQCDEFGALSANLTDGMAAGERVTVNIPVKGGVLDEITVICGGESETLMINNITDIVAGNIGFIVRNASAEVYEVAVINGTDYEEEIGEYAKVSTWTDEKPYASQVVSVCSGYSFLIGERVSAPMTGDNIVPVAIIAAVAFVGAVVLMKKRR